MTGAAARPGEHIERPLPHHLRRRVQDCRVEIALHRPILAHPLPGVVEVDSPVDAHDSAAGFRGQGQQRGVAGCKVNDRPPVGHRLKHRSTVGQHELAIMLWAEAADPAVEDLHGIGSGVELGEQIAADRAGQSAHQLMPGVGLSQHQPLGCQPVAAGAPLNRIAQ